MYLISVIHNPNARRNLRNKHLARQLKEQLGGTGIFYETKNVDELSTIAQDCMKNGTETIGVNGGDGTFHAVLTAFITQYGDQPLPRFLILRGGTMNTVAGSLNLAGTPETILKKWMEASMDVRKQVLKQATLNMNGRYGFIGGVGTAAKFLDAYYDGGDTGPLKVLKMLGRIIPETVVRTEYVKSLFGPFAMRVTQNGHDMGRPSYTTVLASTIREVGLGFALTHRCYEKPGAFHLIVADINPMALIPHLYALWAGKPVNHPGLLHHGPSTDVRIESGTTLRWMMDGDLYETEDPLNISIGPTIEIVNL